MEEWARWLMPVVLKTTVSCQTQAPRVQILPLPPLRAVSSVGRAPVLQAGCREIESLTAHQDLPWQEICNVRCRRPTANRSACYVHTARVDNSRAGVAQLVEQRFRKP